MLWIDFETRSRCDLPSRGVYNYARDISTQVLCLSYAFNNDDVQTWLPHQDFPWQIIDHIVSGGQIRAHNAGFERLILWYVLCPDKGIPEPKLEQFYCTATQARANCAPGSLDDVGRFASSKMRKNHRGNQLIRLLSIPRADGTFNDDASLMQEMVDYCEQDVRTMRAISNAMRQLSAEELHDYHVNERINDRGVLLDKTLALAAIDYAKVELIEIENLVQELTHGAITSVRSARMKEWVLERVGCEAKTLMEQDEKYSIDKRVRANLLILAEENPAQVPPQVADVIQCADDLWASSVAKFKRLTELADEDDHRVRGAFIFAGGSATGRATSYGAQVHNFTRKSATNPDAVRSAMVRGEAVVPAFGRRVTDVLKSMLRPALIPATGKSLVGADWAAIEARVNPWLSNCAAGVAKLDLFRTGEDVYKVNAATTFGVPVSTITNDQRQLGKIQELACGFAGGVGAFAAMGRMYNIALPESEAKLMVNGWRMANPWAVQYWQDLESAYTSAIRHPRYEFSAGRVTYYYDGLHLWYTLPSGRVLCYPFARIEEDGVSYAKASWKPAADAYEWPRARLWRGLACENITQAVANDILRHSLRQLDNVVLHVHDEIVVETDKPEEVMQEMERVMCTPPDWAQGLPLQVEITTMQRYGK